MEHLQISVDSQPGLIVYNLSGDLDAGTSSQLRAVLGEQLDGGCDAVIDMRGIRFIDSSGLGVLVGALKRFDAAGRHLRLRAPTPALQRVLETTGLAGAFTIEH